MFHWPSAEESLALCRADAAAWAARAVQAYITAQARGLDDELAALTADRDGPGS